MGAPSHADHRRFVETEGWEKKGTARSGTKTGDHHRSTLVLADGETLYTRVPHGGGQIDDQRLVSSILRDQLRVTEEDFYRCVREGVLPPRPQPPAPERPAGGIDAKLMRNLVRKVGITPAQIATMSKADAVRAWEDYLSAGGEAR